MYLNVHSCIEDSLMFRYVWISWWIEWVLFMELFVHILVLYAYGFSKQDDPEKRT